ncbi:MAG: alpha/beta hydrolase, partial [Oscillospiraceae bacterium]
IDQNLTILILTGDMDPVGGIGKGGKEIYDKLMENEICDISLNIYEGARHDVLNEINRYEVFLDISKWLDDTLDIWNYK